MIELLFVVCLSGTPDQCQQRSLVFTDLTPSQCMMGAQPELAKWVETHPRHVIRHWRCRAVDRLERDA